MAINYVPKEDARNVLERLIKVRKGEKQEAKGGKQRPANLDHFVLHIEDDFQSLSDRIVDIFGSDKPAIIRGLYTISDDFMDDITYYRSLQEYAGDNQKVRCNGVHKERISNWHFKLGDNGYTYHDSELGKQNPNLFKCDRPEHKISCYDEQTRKGCKMYGKLRLRLPALTQGTGLPKGYIEFSHTATSDDRFIMNAFFYIQAHYVDKYNIPLSRIPLMVYRKEERVGQRLMHVIKMSVDETEFAKRFPMIAAGQIVEKMVNHQAPTPVVIDEDSDLAVAFEDETIITNGNTIKQRIPHEQLYGSSAPIEDVDALIEKYGEENVLAALERLNKQEQIKNAESPDPNNLDEWFGQGSHNPQDEEQWDTGKDWTHAENEVANAPDPYRAFLEHLGETYKAATSLRSWFAMWFDEHIFEVTGGEGLKHFINWHRLKRESSLTWDNFDDHVLQHYDSIQSLCKELGEFISDEGYPIFIKEVRTRRKNNTWVWYLNAICFNPQIFSRKTFIESGFGDEKTVKHALKEGQSADFVLSKVLPNTVGALAYIKANQRVKDGEIYFTVDKLEHFSPDDEKAMNEQF